MEEISNETDISKLYMEHLQNKSRNGKQSNGLVAEDV